MTKTFKSLKHHIIDRGTTLNRRSTNRPTNISLGDPALTVMTDLNDITPFSIEPTATINSTNDKMIACGVRLLFVTNSNGTLKGLVTSTDVLGEKPVKYITEHGGKREDILCQDIMTSHDKLDALSLQDVERATVGDIVETMKMINRQHILVTDSPDGNTQTIRGIISTTQISHQLGKTIEPLVQATTFSEVEQAVMAH